ncbi:hypothetical protein [Paenisporosarcina sp. TG20]|uniref:hypothetical protein n=1 Tax=Paenisporosarcina sp. TG20 TaxID=1211706 RepID=UPI00037D6C51|nr:hypothetical protein [Paenisporosarcina sp. TG20]
MVNILHVGIIEKNVFLLTKEAFFSCYNVLKMYVDGYDTDLKLLILEKKPI